MQKMSSLDFLTIVSMEWTFKANGGRLDNLLQVAKKHCGNAIYERIWSSLADIWEAIGEDGRMDAARAELAAKNAGFNICHIAAWQKLKKEAKHVY